MTAGNLAADLIQFQLIINLLEEEIPAVKELLLPFFEKLGRGVADKDFLVFIILFPI